jgi:hypothetical protein
MRNKIVLLITLWIVALYACESTPSLNSNVSITRVSSDSPAKDHVIVYIEVSTSNNYAGKVNVGAQVDCGTVTFREKRVTAVIPANSTSTVAVEFKGIQDRIPTMAKDFRYQAMIYSSGGRVIDKTSVYTGTKLYGAP